MTQAPPQNDEVILKAYDPVITRRLFGFTTPYHKQILLALVLMFIASAAAAGAPFLVMIAINEGIEAGSWESLRLVVLFYALTAGVQWLATYGRVRLMAVVGQSVIFDLRQQLFAHLQRLSLSFYSRYSVGRVIVRVINDVDVLRDFLSWAMLAVARDFFTLIFLMVGMFLVNPRLALLTLSVLPLMIAMTVYFRKQARANYRAVRQAISWVNSVLAENINGVRVVQAFSRQVINYDFFSNTVNRNNRDAGIRAARVAAAYPAGIDFLGTAAVALVVWMGGVSVLGGRGLLGEITTGVLVAFVLSIERFFEPIRDLSQRYDAFQSTMAAGERILGLLDMPVEVDDAPGAVELPWVRGEVKFEDVSFHYSDDETLVLKQINLHVQAGQTVALVGETGAGKSTLAKLVSRFIDPTAGSVEIDGYDLRQVSQTSLRRQMGIVLQDPFLFDGTVMENIRFGRLGAADEEVIEAARQVGADEFISRLRLGYETPVGEGGVQLSVGQRQLISFARALLADPRILILDEATSSVDTRTELIIQQALARLLKNRTAFVIAHRLSTVVNADRIVVIHDGQIAEEGSHADLLAQGGMYYQLYSLGFEG